MVKPVQKQVGAVGGSEAQLFLSPFKLPLLPTPVIWFHLGERKNWLGQQGALKESGYWVGHPSVTLYFSKNILQKIPNHLRPSQSRHVAKARLPLTQFWWCLACPRSWWICHELVGFEELQKQTQWSIWIRAGDHSRTQGDKEPRTLSLGMWGHQLRPISWCSKFITKRPEEFQAVPTEPWFWKQRAGRGTCDGSYLHIGCLSTCWSTGWETSIST